MIMKESSGFSLIELMVVVAIAGVALGVGLPKLSAFFQGSRMITNTNDLVSAFHIAKSEAVKRQGPVTVCRSANQTTCDLDANDTWEDGYIVFYDADADRIVDAGTDVILKINAGAEGDNVTIRSNTFATDGTGNGNSEHQFVTFNSRGVPKNNNQFQLGTYVICDDRGIKAVTVNGLLKTAARGVVLSLSGKVRSTRDGTKITACVKP